MEEKEVLVQTVQDNGLAGTATIIENSELIDFVNPSQRPLDPGVTTAMAKILSIVKGNPPKEQIIGILNGR